MESKLKNTLYMLDSALFMAKWFAVITVVVPITSLLIFKSAALVTLLIFGYFVVVVFLLLAVIFAIRAHFLRKTELR